MRAGEAALFHGCAGQGREADDVAGCVDVRNASLEEIVDHELAAWTGSESRSREIERVGIGLPANGVKQGVTVNSLATLHLCGNTISLLVNRDGLHFFA